MIEKFREIENSYIENFAKKKEYDDYIIFWDNQLPDMYSTNFMLVKEDMKEHFIEDFVIDSLKRAKVENRDFLKIIFHPVHKLSDQMKETFGDLGFELQTNLYMKLKDNNTDLFQGNKDCTVKKSTSEKELKDGEELDIETSIQLGMPRDFVIRKALRKREVYKDNDNKLSSYLCYHNDKAIGECELHIDGEYAKIEDFDVVDTYQRKGFGTAILEKVISDSIDLGIKYIYLITDKDDTPKEMYKKLGFEVFGEETELFWQK